MNNHIGKAPECVHEDMSCLKRTKDIRKCHTKRLGATDPASLLTPDTSHKMCEILCCAKSCLLLGAIQVHTSSQSILLV